MADLLGGLVLCFMAVVLTVAGARLLLHLFPWLAVDVERDEDDPYPGGM